MEERLQKLLAQAGIASRRRAEQMIRAGTVRVNGQVATLGQKADPVADAIEVNGQRLSLGGDHPRIISLLLHKPLGVVTTCADPYGRPTVLDLLSPEWRLPGLHPVGRLDAQTTGALLLTNDGDLTFYLTHPSHHIPKTYEVTVTGHPSAAVLAQWRQGIVLEGRRTRPAQVRILQPYNPRHNTTRLEVVLREGRKRQIRLTAKALGHPVQALHRTHIGCISLQNKDGLILSPGEYRPLTASEIEALHPIINIKDFTAIPKDRPL